MNREQTFRTMLFIQIGILNTFPLVADETVYSLFIKNTIVSADSIAHCTTIRKNIVLINRIFLPLMCNAITRTSCVRNANSTLKYVVSFYYIILICFVPLRYFLHYCILHCHHIENKQKKMEHFLFIHYSFDDDR